MRLALHDYGGYPFSAELSGALAARGHEVHYLHASGFVQPRAHLTGLTVHPIDPGGSYRRGAGLRRIAHERRYGARLAEIIRYLDPDVVLSANTSIDAQQRCLDAAHDVGAGFAFWLQDLYAEAVTRLLRRRLPVAGQLIGARFSRIERRLLREADAVIAISSDFVASLQAWGVTDERISVVENWAPLHDRPLEPRSNAWSRQYGLDDRPVFLYAGTLGRKHDPAVLVDLAREVPGAWVVVVAEGAGAERLAAWPNPPPNLITLPLQPADRLPEVLASADILVALLGEDAHRFSVPSKVLTYLTAARPILAVIPRENLAARTVLEAGAGIVIAPGDRAALRQAAHTLLDQPDLRTQHGRAGREYAERFFDAERKTDQFEVILRRIARPAHSAIDARTDTA